MFSQPLDSTAYKTYNRMYAFFLLVKNRLLASLAWKIGQDI